MQRLLKRYHATLICHLDLPSLMDKIQPEQPPFNPMEPAISEPQLGQRGIWRRFRRNRTALLGLVVLSLMGLSVLVGPWVYPVSITEIDFAQAAAPPSWTHPFGTNDLGQDQLARVLAGGRISLTVGIAAMLVAIALGVLVGAIAGFYGGLIDAGLMRLTDLFLSLPQLPLLLVYLFRDAWRGWCGLDF